MAEQRVVDSSEKKHIPEDTETAKRETNIKFWAVTCRLDLFLCCTGSSCTSDKYLLPCMNGWLSPSGLRCFQCLTQTNFYHCGTYAIAFLHGIDPSGISYNVPNMRGHLLQGLEHVENKNITVFLHTKLSCVKHVLCVTCYHFEILAILIKALPEPGIMTRWGYLPIKSGDLFSNLYQTISSSLIWVYIFCPNLSVQKLSTIMVILSIQELFLFQILLIENAETH